MNNKVYVAKSKLGLGVFCEANLKKGEKIFTLSGPIIDGESAKEDESEYWVQIDDKLYINPEEPVRRLNHSCNPNAGIKKDYDVVALRNIRKDEEIRLDYSTTMDEDGWTMKCRCGSDNCRKIVKDFKYLPSNLRQKYLRLGIVQNFIAKKYNIPADAEIKLYNPQGCSL